MAEARRATTVLLLRDTPDGLMVFMVQRHRKSGFLPNAWVFPGGRVDVTDVAHDRVMSDGLSEAEIAFRVAGVRETFEESGVWLGTSDLPHELRAPLARNDISLAECMDRHDCQVDLGQLAFWSHWVTPQREPRRYDTRFYALQVTEEVGDHDELETVDHRWVSPQAVLNAQLTFPLAPPTWYTLWELAQHSDVASVLAADRVDRPIQPIMRFGEDGMDLLLPGHPEHSEPALEGTATRISYEEDRWVGWRADERLTNVS